MSGKRYSSQELEILQREFQLGTSLSELEAKLGRSADSIVNKLYALSIQYPDIWNHEKALQYLSENQRRYYQENRDKIRERVGAYQRRRHQEHRDEMRDYQRRYRQEHRDEINARKRRHYQEKRNKWKNFGKYLSNLLNNSNTTRIQQASQLGISCPTLFAYLSGNLRPSKKVLERISQLYNVDYKTLQSHLQ